MCCHGQDFIGIAVVSDADQPDVDGPLANPLGTTAGLAAEVRGVKRGLNLILRQVVACDMLDVLSVPDEPHLH